MAFTSTSLGVPPNVMKSGFRSDDTFIDVDTLRTTFALGLSAMYKAEVPMYGDLVRIVQEVNQKALSNL